MKQTGVLPSGYMSSYFDGSCHTLAGVEDDYKHILVIIPAHWTRCKEEINILKNSDRKEVCALISCSCSQLDPMLKSRLD